ncbi:hypothetical protein [Spiroplasma endosymbiont of Thecophora atra]
MACNNFLFWVFNNLYSLFSNKSLQSNKFSSSFNAISFVSVLYLK